MRLGVADLSPGSAAGNLPGNHFPLGNEIWYSSQISWTVTVQSKREFLQLVVEKETTKCWSWVGEHDADGRPVFRGEKAYRVMYELRNGDVPTCFHVHHKCENSSCVNPRHLVALSPEAHRAVHGTRDPALKERIYRGEWERIKSNGSRDERRSLLEYALTLMG